MLDLAINHTEEVTNKFRSTWYKDKYKFFHATSYCEEWHPEESTWTNHQFVSMRGNEVIGYIGYSIDRADGDIAYGLCIINFEDKPSATFAVDLGKALRNIFEKYCFRKLRFTVIVGNPIEKSYDKMCLRYGGRIVGVLTENVRLIDGKFYDEKIYEIMRSDYLKMSQYKKQAKKTVTLDSRLIREAKPTAPVWLSDIMTDSTKYCDMRAGGVELPDGRRIFATNPVFHNL